MSLRDTINFLDKMQQRKMQEGRFQQQQGVQMAQLADVKDKELKVLKSQKLLNSIGSSLVQPMWKDGKYVSSGFDELAELERYRSGMINDVGVAPDDTIAMARMDALKKRYYTKASQTFQSKLQTWEAENPDEWFSDYDAKRKKYVASIGGAKLYSDLTKEFGPVQAGQLLGVEIPTTKTVDASGWNPLDIYHDMQKNVFGREPDDSEIAGGAAILGTAGVLAGGITLKKTMNLYKDLSASGEARSVDIGKAKEAINVAQEKLTKHLDKIDKGSGLNKAKTKELKDLMRKINMLIKRGDAADPAIRTKLDSFVNQLERGINHFRGLDTPPGTGTGVGSGLRTMEVQAGIETPIKDTKRKASQILKSALDKKGVLEPVDFSAIDDPLERLKKMKRYLADIPEKERRAMAPVTEKMQKAITDLEVKLADVKKGGKLKALLKGGIRMGGFVGASYIANNIGTAIGGQKRARVSEMVVNVGSMAMFDQKFWKWAIPKLTKGVSKRAAAAAAASLADGPLPFVDFALGAGMTLWTGYDFIQLYKEWDQLSSK